MKFEAELGVWVVACEGVEGEVLRAGALSK